MDKRKLTKPEVKKREDIIKGMKSNKSSFVKKYGKDAEKVMYGSATQKAKELAETKENRLRKMIEDALKYGISEKKAKKDYDGDGKIESSTEEYKGSRDKAIKKAIGKDKKFTLKEEPGLKKGDKVTYLGYPGEITGVNKEMTGAITYNVLYDKGTGKTKATNIYNKDGEIKPLNEDWGSSDEGALLQSMHNYLKSPSTPPSIIDVLDASEDANDFYREDESDYGQFRESNIRRSAQNYYRRYFPDFYEGMKKMFSENLNEDWIADSAKLYWLDKFKKGLIDKLPDNPKEAFLAQMTKDQIEHDEETLRRERGLEEDLDLENTGLIVTGRTPLDNDAIEKIIEEYGYYGIWNSREGYWFFPEEEETMDRLENELETIFTKEGIDARFEGQFNESKNRNVKEDLDLGHMDDEPHMLKGDLYRIGKYAMELYQMVDKFEGKGEVDFPHWWQSKITKAKDMLVSAKHYLDFEIKEPEIDAMVGIASREDVLDRSPLDELKEKVFSKLKGK